MSKVKIAVIFIAVLSTIGGLSYAGINNGFGFHPEQAKISGKPAQNLTKQNNLAHKKNVQFKTINNTPSIRKPDELALQPLNPLEQPTLERKSRRIH